MFDLNGIVNEKINEMSTSGEIEKIIQDRVEKTINDSLNEAFRSYSPFAKSLDEHINKTLNVDFSGLGLEGYNHAVLNMLQSAIDRHLQGEMKTKLEEMTNEILACPPEKVTLSELVKAVIDENTEDAARNDWGEMTLIVEGRTDRFFTYIYLDPKPCEAKYKCALQIGVSKTSDKSKIFSVRINDRACNDHLFVGPVHGLARLLFKAAHAETEFVFDVEAIDVDLSYPEFDEDY